MIPCPFRPHKCNTILTGTRLMKLHRNMPNATFKRGMDDYSMAFKSFNAFKSHSYRYHNKGHL